MSLRKAINQHCKQCIHDPEAPGTWRAQVTLCSVKSCPLWSVRPRTTRAIPDSVLAAYEAEMADFQQ